MDGIAQRLMSHRDEFLVYLRRQGATQAEAEDLLQSALVRGLEPWSSSPPEASIVPWFYRVLHNALIDQARRASAAGRALERYADEAPQLDVPVEARRVCKCTYRVLASLKPEYARVVKEVDIAGATVDDAARRIGITPNNASVRLHRARKALRERLEALCGSCATGGERCTDCYCQPDEGV